MNKNIKRRFARRLSCSKTFTPKFLNNEKVNIFLDEYEAMRLCDYEEFSQIDASTKMNVSRATIQRLLINARSKFIDATLNDKQIIIDNNIENINIKGEHNMDMHLKKELLVAIPTNNKQVVSNNFGGAEYVALYNLKNNNIAFVNFLNMPQHLIGSHPKFLKDNNVDLVLTNSMGRQAINLLKDYNIDVVLGASGVFEDAIREYLEGTVDFESQFAKYSRNKTEDLGRIRGQGCKRGFGFGYNQGLGLGRNKKA